MKRREFITLLGGAAMGCPVGALAQQPERMRRIGVLINLTADDPQSQARIAVLLKGLQQFGWAEGLNIRIDYRWGSGDVNRLRNYAAELIALAADVVLAGGSEAVATFQQASRNLPIVFVNVADPVGAGYVDSLARPGGNATGLVLFEYGISPKWLELLKEIASGVTRMTVIRDAAIPTGIGQFGAIQAVSSSLGVEVSPLGLRDANEIQRAPTAFAQRAEWRPHRDCQPRGGFSSRPHHQDCCPSPFASGLSLPLVRYQRGPDVLRARPSRPVSASGRLHRPHPKRREASRPSQCRRRRGTSW
jgi:ABC-type uncharacterized transport system substrate-binding protein